MIDTTLLDPPVLIETDERLQLLFRVAPDAMLMIGPDNRVRLANGHAERLLAYSGEDLIGKPLDALIPPRFRERHARHVHRYRKYGGGIDLPRYLEVTALNSQGQEISVEVGLSSVKGPDGLEVLAALHDISDRKAADARILVLNRMLKIISEINQLVVRVRDKEALLREACRITVERGEFRMAWVGMTDRAAGVIRPLVWAGHEQGYLAAIEVRCDESPLGQGPSGKAVRENRAAVVQDTDSDSSTAPWRKEARARGYRALASFPLRVAGEVVGVFSVQAGEVNRFDPEIIELLGELTDDLGFALEAMSAEADRQRIMRSLQETSSRLNVLIQSAPVAILSVDLNGRVTAWNKAAEKLFGFTAEEALGKPLQVIPEEGSDAFFERVAKVLEGKSPSGVELIARRKDGSRVEIEASATPLWDSDGAIVGIMATVTDLTEHNRLEQELRQAQKMEAVGLLAGGVAHDFNNLLQAIMSTVELLRLNVAKPGSAAEGLKELEELARRGASLTHQLLLFSRQESARFERLDLNDIVTRMARLLLRMIRENIRIELETADEILGIEADRQQIEQVLMNLAVNASDVMPEGGALTITTSVEPNGHVGLTVCDTGPGIEPALRERVFDPFFTTKAAGKGTGLGLAVVHGIVMRHGGTISICDAPGRGACVKIVLPRAELGDTAAAAPAISQEAGAASVIKKGIRILIVEDEQGAREALHGILSASGFEVASVATAEAALELPDSPGFDLLLTDYQLPDGLGDQLAQVLLQRWQELAIILMSGYAEDRLLRQAVRHGSIRFLQKPFPFAVLEREIVTALREQGITPG